MTTTTDAAVIAQTAVGVRACARKARDLHDVARSWVRPERPLHIAGEMDLAAAEFQAAYRRLVRIANDLEDRRGVEA